MRTLTDKYDIESLLDRAKHPTYSVKELSLNSVNILTQVRRNFEQSSIEELAQNIALNGLIQPPTIAQYDQKTTEQHLEIINTIHGQSHKLIDLKKRRTAKNPSYFILIAGERRFRALNLLYERGCRRCLDENGNSPLTPGICFKSHFQTNSKKMRFSVSNDVIPFQALLVQFSENDYVAPKPHEEARVYGPYFRLLRLIDKNYSVSKFSRRVARGTEKVKNAIGYFDLPAKIHKYVEDSVISYGVANQLARLQQNGLTEDEIDHWLIVAVSKRYNVTTFKKVIDLFLEEDNSGQSTLYEIWEKKNNASCRAKYKSIIDPQIDIKLLTDNLYLKNVARLIQDGLLVEEDEIYSTKRSKRYLFDLVDVQKELLPRLEKIMKKDEFSVFKKKMHQVSSVTKKMSA